MVFFFRDGSPYYSRSFFLFFTWKQQYTILHIHTLPNGKLITIQRYICNNPSTIFKLLFIFPFSKSIIGLKMRIDKKTVACFGGIQMVCITNFTRNWIAAAKKCDSFINFHVVYMREIYHLPIQSETNPIFGLFCDFVYIHFCFPYLNHGLMNIHTCECTS